MNVTRADPRARAAYLRQVRAYLGWLAELTPALHRYVDAAQEV